MKSAPAFLPFAAYLCFGGVAAVHTGVLVVLAFLDASAIFVHVNLILKMTLYKKELRCKNINTPNFQSTASIVVFLILAINRNFHSENTVRNKSVISHLIQK